MAARAAGTGTKGGRGEDILMRKLRVFGGELHLGHPLRQEVEDQRHQIRVPLMQGLPAPTRGSIEIRCSRGFKGEPRFTRG
jgi:hypothetical protein